jgi:hypothetical protein
MPHWIIGTLMLPVGISLIAFGLVSLFRPEVPQRYLLRQVERQKRRPQALLYDLPVLRFGGAVALVIGAAWFWGGLGFLSEYPDWLSRLLL